MIENDELECTTEEMNDELRSQLDEVLEVSDYYLGLLAVHRDLVGQLVVGAFMENLKDPAALNEEWIVQSVDRNFAYMSVAHRSVIKDDFRFHLKALKENARHASSQPAWRDDHPLEDINELEFSYVMNRYY